ncbi:MAG: Phage virion morphosis family [Thermoleophilia bacterium]|nr:Phage virion morphosis family [Thermoleophilia bacterium]
MAARSFRDLQAELNEVAERGADARPVLRNIADDYREAQRVNFARGGKPRWKALNPTYADRKAATGHGSQIGVFSGGLRDSLARRGARYNVEKVDTHDLQVGTRNPVANLFNSKHSGRNQPKRKVQALTPAMRRDFLEQVQEFLVPPS